LSFYILNRTLNQSLTGILCGFFAFGQKLLRGKELKLRSFFADLPPQWKTPPMEEHLSPLIPTNKIGFFSASKKLLVIIGYARWVNIFLP